MQSLKLASAVFLYQQMIALKKLRKILFYVLKILKILNFQHPLFFPLLPVIAQEDDGKINPKVYEIINYLNKKLNAHFV